MHDRTPPTTRPRRHGRDLDRLDGALRAIARGTLQVGRQAQRL